MGGGGKKGVRLGSTIYKASSEIAGRLKALYIEIAGVQVRVVWSPNFGNPNSLPPDSSPGQHGLGQNKPVVPV